MPAAVSADLRRAGFESEQRSEVVAWKRRKLLMNLGNGVDAAVVLGDDDGGSTWQNLTRGTASEIDDLAGEVVLLGRLNGVPTPVNAAVQALTRQLAGSGAGPGASTPPPCSTPS